MVVVVRERLRPQLGRSRDMVVLVREQVRLWLWGFGDMVGLGRTRLSNMLILLIYGNIVWHIILPIKVGNAAMVILLRGKQVIFSRGLVRCV